MADMTIAPNPNNEYAKASSTAAQYITELCNEVLDSTKLKSGKPDLEPRWMEVVSDESIGLRVSGGSVDVYLRLLKDESLSSDQARLRMLNRQRPNVASEVTSQPWNTKLASSADVIVEEPKGSGRGLDYSSGRTLATVTTRKPVSPILEPGRIKPTTMVHNSAVNRELLNNRSRPDMDSYLADDGQEAIDLAEKDKYRIIFTDLQMPTVDGWQAIAQIRNKPSIPKHPLSLHSLYCDRPFRAAN
ncbi:hypothetical protein SmJEL517_g01011 [Synchytrium microbalum]|uniref:Response regulatory domain-containing protein n=1 Tax=Synchytrium microbalum TaxID=1806994 RepID=A0A507CGH6_9FUNG|nr:uncharacterized protein SmJEL517_g01011 [Synchytrium microbalum]TPX37136.1 hypothetical protein SmJEL517_g01011 [Synchytrium microbalum]